MTQHDPHSKIFLLKETVPQARHTLEMSSTKASSVRSEQLLGWYLFGKINFIVGNHESVVESDFYTN